MCSLNIFNTFSLCIDEGSNSYTEDSDSSTFFPKNQKITPYQPHSTSTLLPNSKSTPSTSIPPQWDHPFLHHPTSVSLKELEGFSYDYYIKFSPFFKNQPQGSIAGNVLILFSSKMRTGLGLADLFTRTIKLNEKYFLQDPTLIPYTLFHELTHIWLYDCYKDPSHTLSFYQKMNEFNSTGLPIDSRVHIHSRLVSDAKFIYICPNCKRRWFTNKFTRNIYCGLCKDNFNQEFTPSCYKNPDNLNNKNYKLPYFIRPK